MFCFVTNEKDLSGRECNDSKCANKRAGLERKSRSWPYLQEKAVCSPTSALDIGKERMLSEGLRSRSFAMDSDELINAERLLTEH